MKINKKTLAKELVSSLRLYSYMVDYFDSQDDVNANIYRARAYGIQELAITMFGVEDMCGYWKKELIENLEKIAQG
jgi:hypothetical protein